MAWFRRHFGVDYSGAQTPTASWTRRGIAEWLVELGALPPGHRNCPLCFPCASQLRLPGSNSGAYLS
jgi:hypothetical protein